MPTKEDVSIIIVIVAIGLLFIFEAIIDHGPKINERSCNTTDKKVMVIYTENRTSLNPRIEYDKIIVCDDEGCYISKKLMRKGR